MRIGVSLKTFYFLRYLFPILIGFFPLLAHASAPGKPVPQKQSVKTASLNPVSQTERINSWKDADVLPGVVVVKYKTSASQGGLQLSKPTKLLVKLASFGVTGERSFSKMLSGQGLLTKKGQEISRISILSYASEKDPRAVAEELSKDENVEYAEPYFVRHLFYTPNDPSYSSSWWLQNIQAAQAWEIVKGDTAVTIGIVDTGVQWTHPDLAANIKHNWAEIPNNGIDDDHNGYIDDVVGWDFGSTGNYTLSDSLSDNNPDERASIHGTHCAGIAAAVTNNGVGVSSIGFNSKILPVKASIDKDLNNGIYYGYEGILYAAERGAKIVSCSWGGDGYAQSEQDIINYVSDVKGALVVAAVGNNYGRNIDKAPIYPACYDNVLAVGAVDQYDAKANFSNYGAIACDIMAPGASIYSTWRPDSYAYMSGTSMACPMVAGSAALVAAKFLGYTPEQIAEQIRATADNIDAQNPSYAGKLGKGMLNIYKAVTVSNAVSIRLKNVELTDIDGDGYLAAGDTVDLKLTIRNVLTPVSGITVTVTSQNAHVSMLQGSFAVSSLGSLADYTDQTIRFVVDGNVALDETIDFNVAIATGGGYTGNEAFSATVQSSYLNLSSTGSNVTLTVNNHGNFGFNDYPNNLQGIGLRYKDKQMLYEGALMIGTSATTVEDVARNGSTQSADFEAQVAVKKVSESSSVLESGTTFNDTPVSVTQRLGLEITEHVYLFPSPPDTSYAIAGYVIRNTSGKTLSNLHVGLLMDWDVVEYAKNSSGYDAATRTLYTFHNSTNTYAGITSLGKITSSKCEAVTNLSTINDQIKWNFMSGGIQTGTLENTDVISFLTSGPFEIAAGDSLVMGFGLTFGTGKAALLQNATLASQKWSLLSEKLKAPTEFAAYNLKQNFPNPFNPTTTIVYEIPTSVKDAIRVDLKIYDVLGRLVKTLVNSQQIAGRYTVSFNGASLSSGVYFYRLQAGSFVKSNKMVLVK